MKKTGMLHERYPDFVTEDVINYKLGNKTKVYFSSNTLENTAKMIQTSLFQLHLEAAQILQYTEDEFLQTLDWNEGKKKKSIQSVDGGGREHQSDEQGTKNGDQHSGAEEEGSSDGSDDEDDEAWGITFEYLRKPYWVLKNLTRLSKSKQVFENLFKTPLKKAGFKKTKWVFMIKNP